jgi:uncharacterized phage protein (TIGR02220 family)
MSGWIKLHRSIMEHWVSDEPELLAVFIRLLSEANHTNKARLFNGCLVDVKRGQLIYGREAFSKRSGVSIAKLRRYMALLQKSDTINQQITNKYSIITITNYDQYQVIDQQTTSESPAANQQVTTPKECKELNNGNNKQLTLSGRPDDAPVSEKLKATKQEAIEVLEFLNEKTGRNYKPVDANVRMINARLKEYSIVELRQVVAKKTRDWRHDENMEKYLRPATLFNATNCAQYVGELGQRPVDGGQR